MFYEAIPYIKNILLLFLTKIITYEAKPLNDDKCLYDYNISNNASIQLIDGFLYGGKNEKILGHINPPKESLKITVWNVNSIKKVGMKECLKIVNPEIIFLNEPRAELKTMNAYKSYIASWKGNEYNQYKGDKINCQVLVNQNLKCNQILKDLKGDLIFLELEFEDQEKLFLICIYVNPTSKDLM